MDCRAARAELRQSRLDPDRWKRRRAFSDPLAVDFGRFSGKLSHWALGAGPHICRARIWRGGELRIVLEEVLPALPPARRQ